MATRAVALSFAASCCLSETRLLFVAKPNGTGINELYSICDDGTGLTRITTNSIYAWSPALSPDTNTVAYVRNDGVNGIFLTTLSGAAPVIVCNSKAYAVQWADTNTLFYVTDAAGNYEIWKVNRDGSNNMKAYTAAYWDYMLGIESFCIDRSAGKLYVPVFNMTSFFKSRLSSGLTSGTAFTAIFPALSPLNTSSDMYTPAISANGLKIAYAGDFGTGGHRVYCSNKDGSGTATTVSPTFSANPSWGPDGTWIVCTLAGATTSGSASYVGNIVKYKSDGSGLVANLTASSSVAGSCAFPIVYQVPIDGNANGMADAWELYYFGSLSATNGAPAQDWDNDGFSNLSEFIAGTNPTNAVDKFTVQIAISNGDYVVSYYSNVTNSFYGGMNRYYDLLNKTNIADSTWLPVPGQTNIICTNAIQQYRLIQTNQIQFFKAKVRLQ